MSENDSYVTRAELGAHLDGIEHRLERTATKWEVRFLILAAFIGGQLVPQDVTQAALHWLLP